jgi:hypothetical protein
MTSWEAISTGSTEEMTRVIDQLRGEGGRRAGGQGKEGFRGQREYYKAGVHRIRPHEQGYMPTC